MTDSAHTENVLFQIRSVLAQCPSGDSTPAETLPRNRIIGLYFSGSWSPPDKLFTPILVQAYEAIRKQFGEKSFEILLVPLDTDANDWSLYINEMPWKSLKLDDRETAMKLFLHFNVSEIPCLVVIDNVGEVISYNARGTPGKGFGFGCDPIDAYKFFTEKAGSI